MTFAAYTVAIKLKLADEISGGIVAISQKLGLADKQALALNKTLYQMEALGRSLSASGAFGLGFLSRALKPAEEYAHQLNIMNMAGMKQAEIATAIGDAWKLAGDNITTTATTNLKALLDLRNVTGSLQEAREFLPIMQRMQTVLAASKEGHISGHAGDLAFSAMKALDIRGAVNDPERLKAQADLMTRVIEATQGKVTPEMYQSVFNYARQAKFALSDDFSYKILPTLMLENATKGGGGGGSKGVGPAIAALYRFTNQGFVNKQSLPLLKELGLLGDGKILPTTTVDTVVAPLKEAGLAAGNSFEWTNQVVVPRIIDYLNRHHQAVTDASVQQILNMITRGNQLAGGVLGEFYVKRQNFERDKRLLEGTMSPDEAYKAAMTKDPATAHRALSAAWQNFQTSLMVNVVPVVVPALLKLSRALNDLGDFARAHPNLTKDAVIGITAVSGLLVVGGKLMTGLAMARLAFGGVGEALGTAGGTGLVGSVTRLASGFGTLVAAMAPLLAMAAVTKWADDTSHDQERVETLQAWSNKLKSWMPDWMGDPRKKDRERYEAMRRELDGTATDYVRPAAVAGGGRYINNTIVMPDGKVLARVVSKEQAATLGSGATTGGIDHGLSLPMPAIR